MPIKPENRARYPKDWPEVRARALERAGHACEFCGVPNYWRGFRHSDGSFLPTGWNERRALCCPLHCFVPRAVRVFEIVLTIAHLDHTPENCADDNLRALCQRCHLNYDNAHHMQNARATRRSHTADIFG